ncbi:hypothetical protein PHSY_002053 [Pseudozyma hubeiensis SY62]|uniref:Apple domain-containing protein n=1 Tax=Pseudozyma hubeiensis (strain SY62) TaxID=1305764 RepID=R9P040_PSEHS|nr:hypothetical protein PHSY_002053 [Pseudozyma hubeiensis SY62]GAC94481.1 hypothetical protein PHSY_002053 [Pseudozyma hubeiensis SY62]
MGPFIMLIFGSVLVFAFGWVYFMVPETKNISLEDVEVLYSEHVKPWKSAAWIKERDDDDEEFAGQQQDSSLLPTASNRTSSTRSRRKYCCWWKRFIFGISLLSVCFGIFEIAFHGREAESLQAAKAKISQLEQKLSEGVKGGFNRVMATISHPASDPLLDVASASDFVRVDPDIETVKSKSVIVLKTGASVLADRLPVQLVLAQASFLAADERSGQTSPSLFLIYSDAADQIGNFMIHNALANVSDFVRHNADFSRQYNQLHTLLDNNADPSSFPEGWNLDKWKFLYMWSDACRRHPSAEWYIGYEADTYVLWKSLFKFLSTQDSSKETLFGCGSILMRKHELFANGGCPYIISGTLMRSTFGKDPDFASRFDKEVEQSCCGDAELSIALRHSATVPIQDLGDSGARFQNQRPREIVFDAGNWCQPIINFHHLKAWEIVELSKMENEIRRKKRGNETVLYSDVFDYIVPRNLRIALDASARNQTSEMDLYPTKYHWQAFDIGERDTRKGRTSKDEQECRAQCSQSDGCTTWLWTKATEKEKQGDCYMLHHVVRIGEAFQGTEKRTSGWIPSHVRDFQAQHSCNDPSTA